MRGASRHRVGIINIIPSSPPFLTPHQHPIAKEFPPILLRAGVSPPHPLFKFKFKFKLIN